MKSLIIFAISFICIGAYAQDSEIKFFKAELNQNELIASSGTDIPTAARVLQLQLRATGCYKPMVNSPDMFEQRAEYRFNIKSENCSVISKGSKCSAGHSPRYLKPNPNSTTDAVVGADKYIVCIKGPSGSSDSPKGNQ